MEKDLIGKRPTFSRGRSGDNTYRILFWLSGILGAIWILTRVEAGEIRPLFEPTPTPTRIANSYIQEAQAYFEAGRIDDPNSDNDAIDTYRLALQEDPDNAEVWAELARILTYSSRLLSSFEQRRARLSEARQAADRAIELNPDSSNAHAIKAFTLDWSATYALEDEAEDMLTLAYDEAVRSIQLDPNNGLAMAFYAEVLLDQQNWSQAEQYADQAVALFADSKGPYAMDAYRVRATVLETGGAYSSAIADYEEAVKIAPNMTFLYIQIGVNYRHLALQSNSEYLFDQALSYFAKAAQINEQLGVRDPLPYIAIAKTYSQKGDFYIAALNAEKALSLNPTDANTYGVLGIIYFKSRNYESAVPALKCAVLGCPASDNAVLQFLAENHPDWNVTPVSVTGLPLDTVEVAYYYAEYGQVLAFLSRPRNNMCPDARPILAAVRNAYANDSVLMEIVEGSEGICRELGGSQ